MGNHGDDLNNNDDRYDIKCHFGANHRDAMMEGRDNSLGYNLQQLLSTEKTMTF